MRTPIFLVTAALLTLFTACGGGGYNNNGGNNNGGGGSTQPPVITYQDVSGNWQIKSSSQVVSNTGAYIGAVLTGSTSSSAITGIAHIYASSCFDFTVDIPVTGTIDQSKNITMTSATTAGQVVTVNLTSNSSNTMTGTYTIAGGCAAGDKGTLSAALVPNISGTWTGSVQSNTDNSVSQVSAQLTQAQTANSDGLYPLTGNISFPNGTCFTSGNLVNSFTSGGVLTIFGQTNNGVFISAGIITDPTTGKNMVVAYSISGGTCDGDTGQGTLTRP